MKRIVFFLIAVLAFCFSSKAQIVSSHYNDSYGSPYFRVDIMKSSTSSSDDEISFIPSDDGYHGIGFNAAIGYYIPISRTYFFYAPEIGITGRFGNTKSDSDDTYYTQYSGIGLKLVPLQFGYQFEVSSSFSVCPRIGMAATVIPFGSLTHKGGESSTTTKWGDHFETVSLTRVIGCDLVFRNSNAILSLALESGSFIQAGLGIGFLF